MPFLISIVEKSYPPGVLYSPFSFYVHYALKALAEIGPSARQAIPALEALISQLGNAGEDATMARKALLSITGDEKYIKRFIDQVEIKEQFKNQLNDLFLRREFEGLVALGQPALDFLKKKLNTFDDEIYKRALDGILFFDHRAALPILIDEFSPKEMQVTTLQKKRAIITAIIETGEPAVPYLIELANSGRSWDPELFAYIFVQIGPSSVTHLIEKLKQSEGKNAENIIIVLGRMGPFAGGAIPALQEVVDRNCDKKSYAERAIRLIRTGSFKTFDRIRKDYELNDPGSSSIQTDDLGGIDMKQIDVTRQGAESISNLTLSKCKR